MKLTSENVENVFLDCLFKDEELKDGKPIGDIQPVVGQGVTSKFGFHPERLESHRLEIESAINQLPEPFRSTEAGGWSFLNACVDSEGGQWGEHVHVEQLMALGLALGKLHLLMPPELWRMLPGGMPYFRVSQPDPLAK